MMNKSSFWIWSLVIVICLVIISWLFGFGLGGCTSTQQMIATTTTILGSTTTLPTNTKSWGTATRIKEEASLSQNP
jgi:hypothetical protein